MKNSGEKKVIEVDVYSCVSGQGFSLRIQHYTSTGGNAGESLSVSFISGEHLTLNKWHRIAVEMSYNAASNTTAYKGYVDGKLVSDETLSDSYKPRMIRLVPYAPSTFVSFEGYFKNPYVFNTSNYYNYTDKYDYAYCELFSREPGVNVSNDEKLIAGLNDDCKVSEIKDIIYSSNLSDLRIYSKDDVLSPKEDSDTVELSDILVAESTDGLISMYSFIGNAELKLDIRSEKIVAETTFERADLKGKTFNIYLVSYDESGKMTDLKVSPDETIKDTYNSISFEAELPDSAKRISAFLWTKDGMPISKAEFMDVKSIKIFGIGNSYTVDATAYLYPLLKEAGYNNIVIAQSHIDSCTLEKHWNNVVNDSATYDYRRDDCGEWKVQENQKIYDILTAEDWDIITLQQQSTWAGIPETYEDYLTNLINWVNSNKTNKDAKLYYYMTWAYEQGYDRLSYYDNDQMAMYNAIVSTMHQVIHPHKEFTGVIPVGTAVQNMRTSLVGDTMNRDGSHIQYGYGRYTLALSWIKTLTGYNTDNLTYNPNPKSISAEVMLAAKEAVNNAYNTPYSVTASSYPPAE